VGQESGADEQGAVPGRVHDKLHQVVQGFGQLQHRARGHLQDQAQELQ